MEKKILIVEDEVDIREAMAEALSDAGFTITTASDGEAGLATALSMQPDLILLDIKMPKLDGLGVLKGLRQDPWGKDARVVMLTSMDDAGHVSTAHDGNIVKYLIKTHTSLDELVKEVRMALYDAG